jgi:hypothetical protein
MISASRDRGISPFQILNSRHRAGAEESAHLSVISYGAARSHDEANGGIEGAPEQVGCSLEGHLPVGV